MKRKLVKQGIRALTMTLPSNWIQQNNLKAGDEVEVLDSDEALTISIDKKQHTHHITVNVSSLAPKLADRFISRAYQKGYDKITVKFDSPEIMLALKQKVSELMGYEILNITKNSMDIQVISSELELDFDTLLRRTFLILKEMGETCYDAWKRGDKGALKNIESQDIHVNKFLYFCQRYLNRSPHLMTFGSSMLYYQLEILEKLGDELKRTGDLLSGMKVDRDILDIINNFNILFKMSYDFFYDPKREKATDAYLLYKKICESIENKFATAKTKEACIALVSLNSSAQIAFHLMTMRLDTLSELNRNG